MNYFVIISVHSDPEMIHAPTFVGCFWGGFNRNDPVDPFSEAWNVKYHIIHATVLYYFSQLGTSIF